MVGSPIDSLEMDVGARAASKAVKKVVDKFRLQITHEPRFYPCVYHRGGASAEVDCGQAQSLIHWHQEISGAHDAALIAQRLVKRLTQRDAHVFHGVVLVHVKIA